MRGLLLLIFIYATPVFAAVDSQICFYSKANFHGRSFCVPEGAQEADLVPNGWNDRILSIEISGKARVIVYRDVNYRGDWRLIDKSVVDLSTLSGNWGRQISSFFAPGEKYR